MSRRLGTAGSFPAGDPRGWWLRSGEEWMLATGTPIALDVRGDYGHKVLISLTRAEAGSLLAALSEHIANVDEEEAQG
ncbi:hypothetical protein QEH44_gp59 [Arthrobacter phage Shambre1]|uniref:Uncharacterized protein n=1 Tax=Arthrobacter phage Shambre1 TaxID=2927284 RepID=A0A977PSF0_9CAUD|nr:hypothetical protein QEH44_gp59 [Arthrobacter phage Shambre1]UXE04795.1 hypothetical protein SEA_SHAMBRE1_59 [Arthrobacter phage Shambre1]